MEQDYFADESPKKGLGFWICISLIVLFSMISLGIDYEYFANRISLGIPIWYFYIVFAIQLLTFLSIILIVMYRKIGVYLFPIAVFNNIWVHIYYLDEFLYFNVQNLFLIFLALVVIIPKWKFFK